MSVPTTGKANPAIRPQYRRPWVPAKSDRTGAALDHTAVPVKAGRVVLKSRTNISAIERLAQEKFGAADWTILGFVVAVLIGIGVLLGWAMFAPLPHELTQTDAYKSGYMDGSKSRVDDTLIPHCANHIGMDVNTGPLYHDPDTNSCYWGVSSIEKQLAEAKAAAKAAEAEVSEDLKAATAALNEFAVARGVKTDAQWQQLAREFAGTFQMPQAYNASIKVYVAHGGDEAGFQPFRGQIPVPRHT